MNDIVSIFTFYRFVNIKNKFFFKKQLDLFLKEKCLKGTVLLAKEGINASLSGPENELEETIIFIKKHLNIRKINIKKSFFKYHPFNKLKVRLKKEIVSLGKGKLNINYTGKMVQPRHWNKLINNKEIKLIDTRNKYETDIGSFKTSLKPNVNSFRSIPKELKKLNIGKNDKIAMFCTGGIRCEKISAYMKMNGYKEIYQLEGGIINYLDFIKKTNHNSLWHGECFVFDDRVTVNKKNEKGSYLQCYGCRHPIKRADTKLKSYIKGVSCKYCYKKRNQTQKKRSISRQFQIDLDRRKGRTNIFIKK